MTDNFPLELDTVVALLEMAEQHHPIVGKLKVDVVAAVGFLLSKSNHHRTFCLGTCFDRCFSPRPCRTACSQDFITERLPKGFPVKVSTEASTYAHVTCLLSSIFARANLASHAHSCYSNPIPLLRSRCCLCHVPGADSRVPHYYGQGDVPGLQGRTHAHTHQSHTYTSVHTSAQHNYTHARVRARIQEGDIDAKLFEIPETYTEKANKLQPGQ